VLDEMSKYRQMNKEISGGAQKEHAAVELDEETATRRSRDYFRVKQCEL